MFYSDREIALHQALYSFAGCAAENSALEIYEIFVHSGTPSQHNAGGGTKLMATDASEAGAIAALSALNSAALAQAPNPIGGVTSDGPKISSDAITMSPPAANVVAPNHQSVPAMRPIVIVTDR